MRNVDLLRTLSGCRFYQNYLHPEDAGGRLPSPESRPPPRPEQRWVDQLFRKYSLALGWLLLGSIVLIVLPLWVVHPPYGKASLLGIPPMLIGAFSWMAGAWWAWNKDQRVLMAVTLGAMPIRLFIGLAWVWIVLTLREIPVIPFVLAMMWYWILFAVPEFAMFLEVSQKRMQPPDGDHRPTAKPGRNQSESDA